MNAAFKTVRLAIVQPRINRAPKEWSTTPEALAEYGATVASAGARALALHAAGGDVPADALCATEDGCRWCAAAATCPALAKAVREAVSGALATDDDFEQLVPATPTADTTAARLAAAMGKVKLIENFCTAVRAETERRLLAGESVPGYKLVRGRRGARKWVNADEVEKMLKGWRVKTDAMYSLSLISPTEIEKRMVKWLDADGCERDPLVGPRNWAKLTAMIVQPDGAPSVAPETDKRPALTPPGASDSDFETPAADDLL